MKTIADDLNHEVKVKLEDNERAKAQRGIHGLNASPPPSDHGMVSRQWYGLYPEPNLSALAPDAVNLTKWESICK